MNRQHTIDIDYNYHSRRRPTYHEIKMITHQNSLVYPIDGQFPSKHCPPSVGPYDRPPSDHTKNGNYGQGPLSAQFQYLCMFVCLCRDPRVDSNRKQGVLSITEYEQDL